MEKPSDEDLVNIATKMAQELQDFVDEAVKSSDDDKALLGTQALINEWEEIFSRTNLGWQFSILDTHDYGSFIKKI